MMSEYVLASTPADGDFYEAVLYDVESKKT